MARRNPPLSSEDERLWRQVAGTVTPFKAKTRLAPGRSTPVPASLPDPAPVAEKKPAPVVATTPKSGKAARKAGIAAEARPAESAGGPLSLLVAAKRWASALTAPKPAATETSGYTLKGTADPDPLEAGMLETDGRTAGRLKRGKMAIDGRIDLHGMTQDSAHGALAAFLRRGQSQGWRCVLVITGKGNRQDRDRDPWSGERGRGVLRSMVPHWLNTPSLRPLILGYSEARPQHGGCGAIYVMLRKTRDESAAVIAPRVVRPPPAKPDQIKPDRVGKTGKKGKKIRRRRR